MNSYNPKEIEAKWRKKWEKDKVYKVEDVSDRPKCYVLDMFPYPSGAGLHVGHPKGYIATDIYSRFKKMNGFNVLHPMGWDAFGLPAENYAIKNKVHPSVAVEKNIEVFKSQLEKIGFNFDWTREINTTDPEYYRWTQWCIARMFEAGLMEEVYEPIIWCPTCKTGLALEDLEDGKCERCGSVVEKKKLRQWLIKITKYADRLLEGLEKLDWEDSIKDMQRHWIGRSEGAEIKFKVKAQKEKEITVFTTRPDTLFGATYVVVAPEHELVEELKSEIENWNEVESYIEKTKSKTDVDRQATKEKTGVELKGISVIHPVTGESLPVWIADYVMMGYGTGAIMAVPAHDERDHEFAKKFDLPIQQVVAPYLRCSGICEPKENKEVRKKNVVSAVIYNPEDNTYLLLKWKNDICGFVGGAIEDGESVEEAIEREIKEETGYTDFSLSLTLPNFFGHGFKPRKDVNCYDFEHVYVVELHSNKREKMSEEDEGMHEVVWVKKNEVEKMLTLDHHKTFWQWYVESKHCVSEDGIAINSDFLNDLSTQDAKEKMIQWLEENNKGKRKVQYKLRDWVFARQRYWGEPFPFIHKADGSIEVVSDKELPVELPQVEHYEPTGTGESPLASIESWVNVPGGKRETNTMPQWAGSSWYYLRYIDPKNTKKLVDSDKEKYWMGDNGVDLYVGGTEHATRHLIYARFWHKFLFDQGVVSTDEPFHKLINVGLIMAEDGRKMSKRWNNVINPDDVIEKYGADSFRMYEMFIGPFTQSAAWNTNGVEGVYKFLQRYIRLYEKELVDEVIESQEKLINKTIKKVTNDISAFQFNTSVSEMMITVNELNKSETIQKSVLERFNRILAPFAVHLTEELYHTVFQGEGSIHHASWPIYDESKLVEDVITLAVQVNGKMRGMISIAPDASEEVAIKSAKADEAIAKWIENKEPKKIIYVPGKILNIVI
jgi:leucyl-tRNA synthetase